MEMFQEHNIKATFLDSIFLTDEKDRFLKNLI